MSENKHTDWRSAVVEVLGRHSEPMSPMAIVKELQAVGNCPWNGETPEASAGANIYSHIKKEKGGSLFIHPVPRKQLFALSKNGKAYLAELQSKSAIVEVPDSLSGAATGVQTLPPAPTPLQELPKYHELYQPILSILSDGQVCTFADLCNRIAVLCAIPSELRKLVSEKSQTNIYRGRVNWACVYLMRAGLIERPKRAIYKISAEGMKVYSLIPQFELTNAYLAVHYPMFARFIGHDSETQEELVNNTPPTSPEQLAVPDTEETPYDAIEAAYKKINDALANEILDTILSKNDPTFFERLVTQLLEAMGYGGAICYNGKANDEGIDGIIKEDKLGFNKIYIQAKCWDRNSTVGRPDIQRFVGALSGQGADKGAFITTAIFTKHAYEYAENQHHPKVVLIDGMHLARLMIEHNFGVSTQSTYVIKHLDSDFFNEDV